MDLYNEYERYDKSNIIHPTAIIYENVTLGKNNKIGAYTVIGSDGEIRNCKEFKGSVIIGDGNTISEHVTIQRPSHEDAATIIGNNNLIMAHSHFGHDVHLGNNCEICTSVVLGGYVKIHDKVKIKLGCIIRNRLTIHEEALIGMGSVVVKDVAPGNVVYGNPAKPKL